MVMVAVCAKVLRPVSRSLAPDPSVCVVEDDGQKAPEAETL